MSIRIHGDPRRHLLWGNEPTDPRLAWTVCRIRFAWGRVPPGAPRRDRCDTCWGLR